ncbi:MAG: Holliday junction resolvase RuvX [Endomicrobiia bacterium]|nr:Holliday junction resolvase RuvX [Endomicrobiaceae bacterium]MDD3053383.1 Holliday junction resolvase RuvX [Endomicrobiaceae bacterium]MDD3923030.1 Holliday junction resolvase RuvX [Endomicrobiaceae bacterium]MDD5101991.1 Holliday junction resolvase RuvX [Endomicrobiaceae bacterium]
MGRFLGIDYGKKRIGLSLSDILGMMAQPFDVIESKGLNNNVDNILKIVKDNEVSCIVVGVPINMNSSEGEMANIAREFVEELKKKTDILVETIDERLTTVQADRVLIEEANISREKRKNLRDKIAATFILQTYLDIKAN